MFRPTLSNVGRHYLKKIMRNPALLKDPQIVQRNVSGFLSFMNSRPKKININESKIKNEVSAETYDRKLRKFDLFEDMKKEARGWDEHSDENFGVVQFIYRMYPRLFSEALSDMFCGNVIHDFTPNINFWEASKEVSQHIDRVEKDPVATSLILSGENSKYYKYCAKEYKELLISNRKTLFGYGSAISAMWMLHVQQPTIYFLETRRFRGNFNENDDIPDISLGSLLGGSEYITENILEKEAKDSKKVPFVVKCKCSRYDDLD